MSLGARALVLAAAAVIACSCQDYSIGGGKHVAGGGSGGPTVLHVAVGFFDGTWRDGVVDYARKCETTLEDGRIDFTNCCPAGFEPVGFAGEGGEPAYYSGTGDAIQCLQVDGSAPRTVVYVNTMTGYAGTWSSGVLDPDSSCARNTATFVIDGWNRDGGDPPDDFSRCCPDGFMAVGFGAYMDDTNITCLSVE